MEKDTGCVDDTTWPSGVESPEDVLNGCPYVGSPAIGDDCSRPGELDAADVDHQRARDREAVTNRRGECVDRGEISQFHKARAYPTATRLLQPSPRAERCVYLSSMRIRTWLLLGFIVVPVIEIFLFYAVGTRIGIWPTLGIVILTAFVGSWFVSRQGKATWREFRAQLSDGSPPTGPIVHGAMILVSGALLLTPGFLTDVVGLLLLVPSVRERLRVWGRDRVASKWIVLK